MISTTDIKINANTMNNRMNAIMTSMTYKFNETELELNIYRIKNIIMAYSLDQYDSLNFAPVFFRTIWENAVFYMYNYIYIDKALNQI